MGVFTEKTRLSSVEEVHNENVIAVPEKAAVSSSTVLALPVDYESPRPSAPQTPRTETSANPFDTDLEAMLSNSITSKSTRKSCTVVRKSDCHVWPGREHWENKAKAEKRKRSCVCTAGLSRRNRMIVRILFILIVIGASIGIGLGISKSLGAPIWSKKEP